AHAVGSSSRLPAASPRLSPWLSLMPPVCSLVPLPRLLVLFPYTTLFRSRHNSNFFSDKLVLTSVTPASSAPENRRSWSNRSENRSEERFSRNAETDVVCRLLLEQKKKQDEQSDMRHSHAADS